MISKTPDDYTSVEHHEHIVSAREEGGRYLKNFYMGRLRPEVQPLTISYTILAEKVPLLYAFCWKKVPLSHTYFMKSCSRFHVVLVEP